MKQQNLFRGLLSLLVLLVGWSSAWAQTAEVNTILWKEVFKGGDSSTTFSATSTWTNYVNPTTFVAADKSSLSYASSNAMINTSSANNMNGSHIWINKNTTGYFQINGIKLYNASKVKVSWSQTGSATMKVAYAFDGGSTFTDLYSTASAGDNITSGELNVSGHETINLKFYRTSVNTNIRIDNLTLTVSEIEDEKDDVVTFNSISPTELNYEDTGSFVAEYSKADDALVEGEDFELTWASSDNTGLQVSSDGSYIAKAGGTYTVTVTATALDDELYNSLSKGFTVNVTDDREVADISFANAEVFALDTDDEYTQTATVAQGDYTGTIRYAIESTTSAGALIDEATGDVKFDKKGTIVVKATAPETAKYKSNTATYTIKVRTTPTIIVREESIEYGETFAYDDTNVEGGDITITSGDVSIATVDGLEITSEAVGTVTITVATAANDEYIAGSATFDLTITEIAGKSDAPKAITTTIFTDKDLNYSKGVQWNASKAANSFDSSYDRGVQFGAAIGKFTLSTSAFTGTITKVSMVVSTNDSENTISVKVGDTDFLYNDSKTLTLTSGDKNVTRDFVGEGKGDIVISCNDTKRSIYFKSITVEMVSTISYTVPTSGWGTLCCEYPLDFTDNTEVTAYRVAAVNDVDKDGAEITVTKVDGAVKGGVGLLIHGTAGAHDIAYATETTTTDPTNLLVGVLSPTFVQSTEGEYTNMGLMSGAFHPYSAAGIIAASKAYLQIPTSKVPAGAKLNIVIDETTGIKTMDNGQWSMDDDAPRYNISGQRVSKSYKGIVIVNGKKVIVK